MTKYKYTRVESWNTLIGYVTTTPPIENKPYRYIINPNHLFKIKDMLLAEKELKEEHKLPTVNNFDVMAKLNELVEEVKSLKKK